MVTSELLTYVLVLVVVLEIVSFLLLVKYGFSYQEFPYIHPRVIEKFHSFDAELGWCPRENFQKDAGPAMPKAMRGDRVYTIDATGSRTSVAPPGAPRLISTYGDSFCFCRESPDAETWQNILSRRCGIRVDNFGVGNYGLDQALLRLKRTYPLHPTPIVVMAITPYTFERIVSVWKHYSEPGNVLAVKPRFYLSDDRLDLRKMPVESKQQLGNLRALRHVVRQWDENYPAFRRTYGLKRLNLLFLCSSPARLRYVALRIVRSVLAAVGSTRLEERMGPRLFRDNPLIAEKQRYLQALAERADVSALFHRIVGEYVAYANQRDFVPVLMMMPDMANLRHLQEHGHYYASLLAAAQEAYPQLRVVDHYLNLHARDDLVSLFVPSLWHFGPRGNELVADALIEALPELCHNGRP